MKDLIQKGESEVLEFKGSLKLHNQIGEAISAFSNSNGGIIYVGIEDSGKISGVDLGNNTLEKLANRIKMDTDPKIYPSIRTVKIDGKDLIMIKVEENPEKPVFYKDKAYKRVGKSTHRLNASEIRNLAKNSGEKTYWDEQICKGATLDDIDEEKVKRFLQKARRRRDLDIDPEISTKEALSRLDVLKKGKPTNACILLFGNNPQKFFLQSEVRCGKFKGTKAVKPFLDMKVIGGTLINQVDKAEKFVLNNMKKEAWLESGEVRRQEKWEYPPDSVREAIVNAICHRDYTIQSNVQVRMLDDRIEIWGVGSLPEPLTTDDLKKEHKSVLRNPALARSFFLIKFIEQWGTGTNEIIKGCMAHDLPEPEFKIITDSLVVIIRKKITEEFLREKGLNERQIKGIKYVEEKRSITNKEYRKINPDISDRTALNDLKELVKKGLLEARGEKKSRSYQLR
ncbi:MAG: helix-turn-helix domain-containing protein [Thermoplasmata archaeon]